MSNYQINDLNDLKSYFVNKSMAHEHEKNNELTLLNLEYIRILAKFKKFL